MRKSVNDNAQRRDVPPLTEALKSVMADWMAAEEGETRRPAAFFMRAHAMPAASTDP
jgi:hypothetical protein